MKTARIRQRVLVFSRDSGRIPYCTHREDAALMLKRGIAVIAAYTAAQFVSAIRLTDAQVELEAVRAGSFGIRREPLACGGRLYQHQRTWQKELAA